MKDTYLVIGDSFAAFDEEHLHWTYFWTKHKKSTVECIGFPGKSHVTICNVLQNVDFSKYAGIIFHVTDFLRSELHVDTKENKIDQILKIRSNEEYVTDILNTNTNVKPTILTPGSIYNNLKDHDSYFKLNIEWLFRANWLAFKYLLDLIKKSNKPMCLVLTHPYTALSDEILNNLGFPVWKMYDLGIQYSKDLSIINHVDRGSAALLATLFQDFSDNPFKNVK